MNSQQGDRIQNNQRSRGANDRGSHHARGRCDRLPDDEIKLILRGADSVIASAVRAMLSTILKGSKDKRLFQFAEDMELNQNPAYGGFFRYTLVEITDKID